MVVSVFGTLTLAATFTAASTQAVTPYVDGIAEENLSQWWSYFGEPFSNTWIASGHIHYARKIIPWNLMSSPEEAAVREQDQQWYADVTSQGLTVAFAIGIPSNHALPPSVRVYREELERIHSSFPFQILEAWNEPNNSSSYVSPEVSASYADEAHAECGTWHCELIAGDFVDKMEGESGVQEKEYMIPYEKHYEEHLSFSVADLDWGIHPYESVRTMQSWRVKEFENALPTGSHSVWFTEVGAYYCYHELVLGEESQWKQAAFLANALRIETEPAHIFYYQLLYPGASNTPCFASERERGGPQPDTALYTWNGSNPEVAPRPAAAEIFGNTSQPWAFTGKASGVAAPRATLSGAVYKDYSASSSSYYFQYGTSTAYGSSTEAVNIGTGHGGQTATATLTTLLPYTSYHYRLVASNGEGISFGKDETFTTGAPVNGSFWRVDTLPNAGEVLEAVGGALVPVTKCTTFDANCEVRTEVTTEFAAAYQAAHPTISNGTVVQVADTGTNGNGTERNNAGEISVAAGGSLLVVSECAGEIMSDCEPSRYVQVDSNGLAEYEAQHPTIANGTLVRVADGLNHGEISSVAGGAPIPLDEADACEQFACHSTVEVDSKGLAAYEATHTTIANGTLIRVDDGITNHGEISSVAGGVPIPLDEAGACEHFACSATVEVDSKGLAAYESTHTTIANGTLIHVDDGLNEGEISVVAGGAALALGTFSECFLLNNCEPRVDVDSKGLAFYESAHPTIANGTYLIGVPSSDTWVVENGKRSATSAHNGSVSVTDTMVERIPIGSPPTVAGISPNNGLESGGTSVTISGTHLNEATAVRFGKAGASEFTVSPSGTSMTATAPPGAGIVDVTVVNAFGTSQTTAADRFSYVMTAPHNGLAFSTHTEGENELTLTLPHGTGFSFGPLAVPGSAGETAKVEIETAGPAYEDIDGEPESTGKGIDVQVEGFRSGVHDIGPLTVACTVPATIVLAEIPVRSSAGEGVKPYSVSYTAACMLGPGIVNSEQPQVEVTMKATGPEAVTPGEAVTLTGASFTVKLPKSWRKSLMTLGGNEASGTSTASSTAVMVG